MNVNDYYFSDYLPEDYKDVMQIWESTNLSDPKRGDNPKIIQETIRIGGKLFLLKTIQDELIGTAWITYDGRRLHLHHFGIKPSFQNKGFGKILATYCLNFAKKRNMQIKLEVHDKNISAINLYKKIGFEYLGDYDLYIIRKF